MLTLLERLRAWCIAVFRVPPARPSADGRSAAALTSTFMIDPATGCHVLLVPDDLESASA